MKISTRGRYAIRVMLDLAEHNTVEGIAWSGLLLNIRSEVSFG